MSKEQTTVVSIQELVEAYHSTDYRKYREVMKKANVSSELQKTLLKRKEEWRFARRLEFQEEEIELIKKIVWQLGIEARKEEKEYRQVCIELNKAEAIFRHAETAWKRAKKRKEEAENKKKEMEELLEQQSKKLEQMKKFILLHPSATLTALDKKLDSVLVCTKFDVERMKFNKLADCVMDAPDVDLEVTKEMEEKFTSKQELDSAVEYAKLAIHFWLEDKPYELLYNSEGIKYILTTVMG